MTTGPIRTTGTTERTTLVVALGLVAGLALAAVAVLAASDPPIASRDLGMAATDAGDGGNGGGGGGPPGAATDAEVTAGDGHDPDGPPTTEPSPGGPGATPDPLDVMHYGERYWAVLWVGESGDPALDEVTQAIDEDWGPVWSDSEVGCNQGAAEALGVDQDARSVALYFDTEREAHRFADQAGLPSEPTGHAQVTVHCLD